MTRNDIVMTEYILKAQKGLKELSTLARDGSLWAVKEKAVEVEDAIREVKWRSIAIAFGVNPPIQEKEVKP